MKHLLLLIPLLLLSACSQQTETETPLTLYFGDAKIIETQDCSATVKIQRNYLSAEQTPQSVLKVLLQGTTKAEKGQGLTDLFSNENGFLEDTEPLIEYFQGVTVSDGVAVVDFSPKAMMYLNNAACFQAAVKWPIIRTLTEFPEIEEVEFSIDGEVVTDWDA